tara:strand:+ start:8457 stop:9398 length:942 start_codon:yes stop_codon:yes gene_type:complete
MRLLCLFVLVFSVLACTAERVKKQSIVKVNNLELSVQDYAEQLTEHMHGKDIAIIKNTDAFKKAKNKIIADFISHAIIQDYANKNSIEVSEEELLKEIQGYRSNYPDDISFRAVLAEEGIAFERWKEKTRNSLLERKVYLDVSKDYEVPTENELKAYYRDNRKDFYRKTQYKIKQIVLSKSIDAENLYKIIAKKGSFEKLAKEYSIGAEASNGGLLGWVERGVSSIFDEASKLPIRKPTKPIKSDFGYHIVMVDGRRPARYLSFSEVEAQIKEEFIDERRQKIYSSWFEEQKKQAKVYVNEELLASITIDLKQ